MNVFLWILPLLIMCSVGLIIIIHEAYVHDTNLTQDRIGVLSSADCDELKKGMISIFVDKFYHNQKDRWIKDDQVLYDYIDKRLKECET